MTENRENRRYFDDEEYDKIMIPIYVICDFAKIPDYRFVLNVSEDDNFAGFQDMIHHKTANTPDVFHAALDPYEQRFIHNGFFVATPAKYRDILQTHLKNFIEPHLESRFKEYEETADQRPQTISEEELFERKKNFLYAGAPALNIYLTTRQKVTSEASERERSLMDFTLVKRKFILCYALYQNVVECFENFKNPEQAQWESQNRRFINPEDLLADINFKHEYYDWQENEPTVIQFGELIERVADNFNQIAEMIKEACAELDKEKVENDDEEFLDEEYQTTIKRRKFKIQLMMDGMRYMATLNQNLANFIVPLHERPTELQPRMLKYRDMH
ncbi:Oidioi.mRNA.OKI2018_I69.chr1.g1060.t1.cds [Oikopleura dioica]|uniref:Oidioi.mRNA.OKI2018_I69.chr1.g1060.t1.cds n=1 Tax=Oikopleura dioica TaxID=34765 RepID=A0ABN7STW8_OIKDI|nr:Oidioi.mRNA.OKI2018_I69.chr1.g1060.t1.cds [Oikopleura dioica]